MKRLFDVFASIFLLLLLAPLMLPVILAIKSYDGGPILFRQCRIGRSGRKFMILKFRSMVVNANLIGAYSTSYNDTRITPVGRFIRRFSIDELPQLLNVLKGDMSLIGPRPDVPEQRSLYSDSEWSIRHTVRPGITGLAQSTLRSDATPSQRKALDLEYCQRSSLFIDLKIIFWTCRQLLLKGGN